MNISVSSVRIQRFKNLSDVHLDLTPVNVLVGANNSGKSSVLQAIQFVISAAQCIGRSSLKANQKEPGKYAATVAPNDLYYSPVDEVMWLSTGAQLTQNEDGGILLELNIEEIGGALASQDDTADGAPPAGGDDPTLEVGAPFLIYLNVAKGKNGNLAVRTNAYDQWDELGSLEKPFSMYVPGLAGIATHEAYLTPVAVRKAAARGHGNAVLRNVLWQLHQATHRWRKFSAQLKKVFPGYSVKVWHDPDSDEMVHADLQTHERDLPIGLAGTGQLQVIQILAYVNLYSPSLLLLDEPDSHIHPDKQKALLRVICDWAEKEDAKVLIATHSRHLLETLDGDATFHWMQNGKRQAESDFDRVKVLMDLGALDRADLLKNGEIDAVILTEDADAADTSREKNKRKNPLRRLIAANGIGLARVHVWSYEGCTHHHTAKVLSRFIRDTAPAVKILVHRDRDYLSNDEVQEFVDGHRSCGLQVFVTAGTDVESHFIDVDHLAEVTQLDVSEVDVLVQDATSETKEDSLDAFSRAEMEREKDARRAAGKSGDPSPNQVTQACGAQFEADPGKYRHGKKTLKALRRLIQERYGIQPDLLVPSAHLAVPALESFAVQLGHIAANELDDWIALQ